MSSPFDSPTTTSPLPGQDVARFVESVGVEARRARVWQMALGMLLGPTAVSGAVVSFANGAMAVVGSAEDGGTAVLFVLGAVLYGGVAGLLGWLTYLLWVPAYRLGSTAPHDERAVLLAWMRAQRLLWQVAGGLLGVLFVLTGGVCGLVCFGARL